MDNKDKNGQSFDFSESEEFDADKNEEDENEEDGSEAGEYYYKDKKKSNG